MINIGLVSTIINIIWSIFSMLFVLYKFTSFFSYIYNFGLFVCKITKGVFYIGDSIRTHVNTPPPNHSPGFFSKIKSKCHEWFFGRSDQYQSIPLFQTRFSSANRDDFQCNLSDTSEPPPEMYESLYDPRTPSDSFSSIALNH